MQKGGPYTHFCLLHHVNVQLLETLWFGQTYSEYGESL